VVQYNDVVDSGGAV